jgi:hypothetical protein
MKDLTLTFQIPDATIFKQAFSKLNGSYQILLKRKLLRYFSSRTKGAIWHDYIIQIR